MPIEIKELTIKTTVIPTSQTGPEKNGLDAYEVEELRDDFRKMCMELIEEFWEKKSRR